MRRRLLKIVAFVLAAAALPAAAQSSDHTAHHEAKPTATTPMVEGEVRKVDKEAGKLTLRHEPIPNLDMPTMTMVFVVKSPAMLEKFKAGDKVRFAAEKIGGQYTVVQIEAR